MKPYMLLIPILTFLWSCSNPSRKKDKVETQKSTLSDIQKATGKNPDSINYYFDLLGDDSPETLTLTKLIEIEKNTYGYYTENLEKAYDYVNREGQKDVLTKFIIKIKVDESYKTLFEVHSTDNFAGVVTLEQGKTYEKDIKTNKWITFLRVIYKSSGKLDLWCLNFSIDDKYVPTLISKAKVTTENFDGYSGYCLDTVSKHLNNGDRNWQGNDIYFNQAFDNLMCKWVCNENIQ